MFISLILTFAICQGAFGLVKTQAGALGSSRSTFGIRHSAFGDAQVSRAKAPALASVEAVPASRGKPGATLELVITVTPRQGIHIYAPPQKEFKPISLTLEGGPGVKIGKPRFPPSTTRTFEGEEIRVYDRAFSITVPVVLPQDRAGKPWVTGKLLYQACDDLVCYRPITTPLRWDIQIQ
jgi:hypothetical protein